MTAAKAWSAVRAAKITDNGPMIRVIRHHPGGAVSVAHRTFRVDSAARYLTRAKGPHTVEQG